MQSHLSNEEVWFTQQGCLEQAHTTLEISLEVIDGFALFFAFDSYAAPLVPEAGEKKREKAKTIFLLSA